MNPAWKVVAIGAIYVRARAAHTLVSGRTRRHALLKMDPSARCVERTRLNPAQADGTARQPSSVTQHNRARPVTGLGVRALGGEEHFERVSLVSLAVAGSTLFVPQTRLLSLALVAYSALPLLQSAERSLLRDGRLRNDALSSLVVLLAVAMAQLVPAAIQVGLHHFARGIGRRSTELTQREMRVELAMPRAVRRRRPDGRIEPCPMGALVVGDLIRVEAGDIVPTDGRLRAGTLDVDQRLITGEAFPAQRETGDSVYAGSRVIAGRAFMTVKTAWRDSVLARLTQLQQGAAGYRSELQLRAETWSDGIAGPVLVGGLLAWPFIGASAATALLFSAPTESIHAMGARVTGQHMRRIVESGIVVTDGRALETLVRVDTILFDKTGTLTDGQLSLHRVLAQRDRALTPETVLQVAASAEASSEEARPHPLAQTILKAARAHGLTLHCAQPLEYRLGRGLRARVDRREVWMGSRRLLNEAGIPIDAALAQAADQAEARGHSVVFVSIDGKGCGLIEIEAPLRPDARPSLAALKRLGIRNLALVSGDGMAPSRMAGQALGLHDIHHGLLPEDKAELVRTLRSQGRVVAFVGDGVNDTGAMRAADVAISIDGANALATDAAQIILPAGRIATLVDLVDASRTLHRQQLQTLGFWGTFGGTNLAFNAVFQLGLSGSSALYAAFFGAGLLQSSLAGRYRSALRRPRTSPVLS